MKKTINNKLKKNIKKQPFFTFLFVSICIYFLYQTFFVKAETFSWLQTDWSGGSDTVTTLLHPDGQTGWTKYYSADTNIDTTGTPGELNLVPSSEDWIETDSVDFQAGTRYLTNISNNGLILAKPLGSTCTTSTDCVRGLCRAGICTAKYGEIEDSENNLYRTILLGNQWWMMTNLNIGTRLNAGTVPTDNGVIEKFCFSNEPSNCDAYGGLYTYAELSNYLEYNVLVTNEVVQGICPDGWRIPSDEDFQKLEIFLGMATSSAQSFFWRGHPVGNMLKEAADCYGTASCATSEFNFKLAGIQTSPTCSSCFTNLWNGYLWTSTRTASSNLTRRIMLSSANVSRSEFPNSYSMPVRCMKDFQ